MIKFEKVEVQNFNSLGHIDWEFSPGVHAVKGLNLDEEKFKSNGSGKSSLFDSVIWGIFGKTPTGKSADAVIHRGKGSNCFVKLWFSIGENEYRIERYRKHQDFSDNIKVFINEQDKTIHPPSKNQELIDSIIRVPFSLFTSSFIIAQGLDSRFTAMTDFQRKEVIESIRDNQIWEEARESNKEELKKTKGLLDEANKDIEFLQEHLSKLDEDMKSVKVEIREIMGEKKVFQETNDIENLREKLEEKIQKKTEFEEKIKHLEEVVIAEKETEKESLQEQVNELPDEISKLKDDLHKYEKFSRITDLKKELETKKEEHESSNEVSLKQLEENHKSLVSDQNEKLELMKDLDKNIDEKRKEITQKDSDFKDVDGKMDVLLEKIEFYEHALDEDYDAEECPTCGHLPESKDFEVIGNKLESATESYNELSKKKSTIETNREKKREELDHLLKEQKDLNGQLVEIEKSVSEALSLVNTRKVEQSTYESSISSIESQIEETTSKMNDEGLEYDDLEETQKKIKSRISEREEKRSTILAQIKEKKNDILEDSQNLSGLRTKKASLEQEIRQVEENISKIQNSVSEFNTRIETKKSSIEKTADKKQQSLQEVEETQETVDELTKSYETLKTLDGIFSPKGIRAHIISKDISFLNERLDVYSKHFFNDMYIQLDPGVDEEGSVTKIDIPVATTLNFDKTYEDCSGGEKRRIDISIQLAIFDLILSMSSVTTNLLVLDEVFEGLDDEGVKAVMEIVAGFGEDTCCYVISHLPNLGEFVQDEFTFVKKQGTSYLSTDIENDNFYEVQ